MKRWSLMALAVAAVMIAGPAYAQSTTDRDTAKPDAMKSDRMKNDTIKSDTPMGNQAVSAGNRTQVKTAQEALKQKGFDPGPIDGRMGPKTQAALKDYQKAEKLNETGRLDAETMAKLGVQAKGEPPSPAASPRMNDKQGQAKPSEKEATAPKKQTP